MSIFEAVETSIVEQIDKHLKSVAIAAFPDDARSMGRATPIVRILAGYKGSQFRVQSEAPLLVEHILSFEILVEVSGLRTHVGAYELIQTVLYALMGFVPVNAGEIRGRIRQMRPVRVQFRDLKDGMWLWVIGADLPISQTREDMQPTGPEFIPPTVPPGIPITLVTGIWRSKVDADADDPSEAPTVLDQEFTTEYPALDP